MQKGRDFSQCAVEISRRNTQSQTSKSKDIALNRAQLLASGKYTEEDVEDLCKRKDAAGQYICDPNFPERVDLRQYIVNNEVSSELARAREDEQKVASTAQLDGTEALSLTEPGCDFAVDAAPTIHGLVGDLAGAVPTAASLEPEAKKRARGKAKAKGQAKPGETGEGEPEPDKPKTPLQKAQALKTKVFLGSVGSSVVVWIFFWKTWFSHVLIVFAIISKLQLLNIYSG